MLEAFFVTIFFSSLILIKSYQRVTHTFQLYDTPNNRSSHTKPTPLGVGLIFAFILVPSVIFLKWAGYIDSSSFYLLAGGATLCTLLGFIDDIKHLSPVFRLSIQFAISTGVLVYLTNFLSIPFEVRFLPFDIAFISLTFGILFVMWMTNLFNFMDGLDGLLGSQVFVYGVASYFLCYFSDNHDLGLVYLFFSALTLPFLILNWKPAKIFMGDAGAYFFGFSFAFLGLVGKIEYDQSLVAQVILMGSLISDATYTLIYRITTADNCFTPHRLHFFQRLKDDLKWRSSHIVVAYLLVTVFILFPISFAAIVFSDHALKFCFLSYSLSLAFYLVLKKKYFSSSRR